MDTESCERSEKISVSFPKFLIAAMESHIGRKTRSFYLQELVENDLTRAGVLSPDPVGVEVARIRELIAVRGLAAVRSKLDELADTATQNLVEAGK